MRDWRGILLAKCDACIVEPASHVYDPSRKQELGFLYVTVLLVKNILDWRT